MRKLLLTAALLASTALPATARLQLSIGANGSTFTCFDGQLSCDVSGGASNLLTIDQTIGGAFVQLTLTQSTFGKTNTLQLSSSNIENLSGAPISITLLASDTNFLNPVSFITSSGSLTFNSNFPPAAPDSTLKFWADPLDVQGANPSNTPGTLLEDVFGHATANPDSFSGSLTDAFSASAPFSMTEGTQLALLTGGSVTGFNQSMETGVPEPRTWALMGVGFAVMAFLGIKRRKNRLATI